MPAVISLFCLLVMTEKKKIKRERKKKKGKMNRILALFISSFLVQKPLEMKKQKERRNYVFPLALRRKSE